MGGFAGGVRAELFIERLMLSGAPPLWGLKPPKFLVEREGKYAKAKLFGPLGINEMFWAPDPQGISMAGYGLYLQPRLTQLARSCLQIK